jgi:lysophospholipid acyltransferase (LPLAT)-like uncharacterized protein
MSQVIKNNPNLVGYLAYLITRLLAKTIRLKVYSSDKYSNTMPYLFAFWHGKQLLPVMQLVYHKTPNVALVSPSRDGNILSTWLEKLGYTVLRGSSRDNNVRSLVAMVKKLQQGCSLGFGIDGPIGPIYQVKPGMTYLARKTNMAIVPLGSAFAKKWILEKAWDKYQIPKPFTRAVYYIGEPIFVPQDADLEVYNKLLENKLMEAEGKAEELLNNL